MNKLRFIVLIIPLLVIITFSYTKAEAEDTTIIKINRPKELIGEFNLSIYKLEDIQFEKARTSKKRIDVGNIEETLGRVIKFRDIRFEDEDYKKTILERGKYLILNKEQNLKRIYFELPFTSIDGEGYIKELDIYPKKENYTVIKPKKTTPKTGVGSWSFVVLMVISCCLLVIIYILHKRC